MTRSAPKKGSVIIRHVRLTGNLVRRNWNGKARSQDLLWDGVNWYLHVQGGMWIGGGGWFIHVVMRGVTRRQLEA